MANDARIEQRIERRQKRAIKALCHRYGKGEKQLILGAIESVYGREYLSLVALFSESEDRDARDESASVRLPA